MIDYKTLPEYAHASFSCACGQDHQTDIQEIEIGHDLSRQLKRLILNQIGRSGRKLSPADDRILLVADENTLKRGADSVREVCRESGFTLDEQIFPGQPMLVADERTVFELFTAVRPATALMIAVGSGTINDMTRFVSFKTQLPYFIIGTAASMDGYASSVSPLIYNNLKTTYETWGAAAILADVDVLAQSPAHMTAAGLGDLFGKYSAICDWRIGNLINAEYYCADVADLVLRSVALCLEQVDGIVERRPEAVSNVMDGLILTGIAMSYVGNSRPASGSEHHLSHFWEMCFLNEGREAVLHGTKVGLATLATCTLYRNLLDIKPDFAAARQRLDHLSEADRLHWLQEIHRVYGASADEVLSLEVRSGKNDPATARIRLDQIEARWTDLIQIIARTIPDPMIVETALRRTQGAVRPQTLGISRTMVADAIRFAKEIRPRYSVLQLYWDLGLMDQAVELITKKWF